MHRLALTHVGDPADALELLTTDPPTPADDEVLVEMQAATINSSDFLHITGRYFTTPEPGSGVGSEGLGRVLAAGADVDDALVGRRVVLLPTYRHGSWATHVIAKATDVVTVPDGGDPLQLSMLGVNPMTALRLLRDYGNPHSPDRWIGQTAGNSAVGEYLTKLAHHFGYRTLSVVRRDDAAHDVLSWGADHAVLDGPTLDDDLSAALDGRTLDIAVDPIGGPAGTALAHHLRYGGTLIGYATLSGQPPHVSLVDLLGNHAHLTGFWLPNWITRGQHDAVIEQYHQLADLIVNDTLSARINGTFPLAEWRDAVSLAQRFTRNGKVLFTFDD